MTQHKYSGPALTRWKVGHRLFFVQIDLIILAIRQYVQEPTEHRLRRISDLLRGSAAMMQFCADFGDPSYASVRDSMANVDSNFTGVWSADHRVMIQELKKLRTSSTGWSPSHCDLEDAIRVAYAAHAFICRRFVGDDSSLANKKVPGHKTLLEKFMPRTLAAIGAAPNSQAA
ncbi:MAG: hypothetical protein JO261_07675 [Alphaproteobacteria bacterium]|nr:hypothetical protein [Alphaproteobacteria bacterium]